MNYVAFPTKKETKTIGYENEMKEVFFYAIYKATKLLFIFTFSTMASANSGVFNSNYRSEKYNGEEIVEVFIVKKLSEMGFSSQYVDTVNNFLLIRGMFSCEKDFNSFVDYLLRELAIDAQFQQGNESVFKITHDDIRTRVATYKAEKMYAENPIPNDSGYDIGF